MLSREELKELKGFVASHSGGLWRLEWRNDDGDTGYAGIFSSDPQSKVGKVSRASSMAEAKAKVARLWSEWLAAELEATEPTPLADGRIEEIVRSATNARWCDGCGDMRPFDPDHHEKWSQDNSDGCLWNYCTVCTRKRDPSGRPS